MTTALALALILFVAALVVFAIDLMIPTGGILVAVTGILCFAAIFFAFRHSQVSGVWMLIATLSLIPIMLFFLLVVWPRTPFGRRMMTSPDPVGEFVWSDASDSDPKALIGATGVAESEFLPRGSVRIGERSYEAVSDAGWIAAGQTVKVMRLDVGRLVVMPVIESPKDRPISDGSALDQPISDLGLDSLQ
jgi:membrane-bound ClpP family serine protease